jgi:hypothetical protein
MPGLVIDGKEKTIHIDSSRAQEEIQGVYESYLAADIEYFKISEEYAAGFYAFLDCLRKPVKRARYVKGQITGPASFALTLTDENKRCIIYDNNIFDAVTKVLIMKARWQIRKLKTLFPDVIIFIDEPYLVSLGSSYVNINAEEVAARLDETGRAIKDEGALCGIHCCGNTDWNFILKRDVDIVNFDAYNFTKEFTLYADEIKAFLAKGGTIAWGIVPSSDAVDKETDNMLVAKMQEALAGLAGKGIDKGKISSLITPSCGVGSLDDARAKKVLGLVKDVSQKMKAAEPKG